MLDFSEYQHGGQTTWGKKHTHTKTLNRLSKCWCQCWRQCTCWWESLNSWVSDGYGNRNLFHIWCLSRCHGRFTQSHIVEKEVDRRSLRDSEETVLEFTERTLLPVMDTLDPLLKRLQLQFKTSTGSTSRKSTKITNKLSVGLNCQLLKCPSCTNEDAMLFSPLSPLHPVTAHMSKDDFWLTQSRIQMYW